MTIRANRGSSVTGPFRDRNDFGSIEPFPPPAHAVTPTGTVDLMFLFNQAGHALNAKLNAALAEVGVSPRPVVRPDQGDDRRAHAGPLADMAGVDKTTMVVTLDRLEGGASPSAGPPPPTAAPASSGSRRRATQAASDAGAIVDRIVGETLGGTLRTDRCGLRRRPRRPGGRAARQPLPHDGAGPPAPRRA